MSHKISQDFNEEKWIAQVCTYFDEDEEEVDPIWAVGIFKIPKTLLSDDLNLFIPQQVSIGPYHYLRDQLFGTEKVKYSAAKRTRKTLPCSMFECLIEQLVKLEMRIRACYNNFLTFKGETLAWMMAIDACFMIEIIDTINDHVQKGREMPHILDFKGYKLSYNIILQDLAMLENQIPLFVLRKVLEYREPLGKADDSLAPMMVRICKELSPFGLMQNYLPTLSEFHLLDFLYRVITVGVEEDCEILHIQEDDEFAQSSKTDGDLIQQSTTFCTGKVIPALHEFLMALARKVMVSRLVNFLTVLSWKAVSSIPPISMVKQPLEYYFYAADNQGTDQPSREGTSNMNKPALIEEIRIPSVSDLVASGIKFLPTSGGISTTSFDVKMKIIYLPILYMETHTEVVLKNLVSYEALVILGPMILTRFTEMMNGIIDTDEDVRLLRENGILINYLKSDTEVTSIWNGMRKSNMSTKVPFLDKVIGDINEYYDSRWQVKARQLVHLYVLIPWKFLVCLGIILLVSLVTIQTLFTVYRYARF